MAFVFAEKLTYAGWEMQGMDIDEDEEDAELDVDEEEEEEEEVEEVRFVTSPVVTSS